MARFIVAPNGYGKSGLALEYAETIFGFDGVIWMNCKSPCFIRDLDNGDLITSHLAAEPAVRLVVFEDVPYLDALRAQKLSEEIDALLERDCEVIVTCVPYCDVLGRLQHDRVRIAARDLLLDDEELLLMGEEVPRSLRAAAQRGESSRVAALLWDMSPSARREFLAREFGEDMPHELRLALVCTAILGQGSFADLADFGLTDKQLIETVAPDYPHFGFDAAADAFEAPPFEIEDIAQGFRTGLEELVEATPCEGREEFAFLLADALIRSGNPGRACDVVRTLCPRKRRIDWVEKNAATLIAHRSFLALLRLVESLGSVGMPVSQRALVALVESLCLRVLGDGEGACRCAKRCAFDHQVQSDVRAAALLELVRHGSTTLLEQAHAELVALAREGDIGAQGEWGMGQQGLLVQAWFVSERGLDEFASFWVDAQQAGASARTLAVMATWFYDDVQRNVLSAGRERSSSSRIDHIAIERFVREAVDASGEWLPDYFAGSAGVAMAQANQAGMPYFEGPLASSAAIKLRDFEMDLLDQRMKHEAEVSRMAAKHDDWLATHPDYGLVPQKTVLKPVVRLSIPELSIKTFGFLELRIGGELLDQDRFAGKHVRGLIVLLASNQGHELGRDEICRSMWPNSPLDTARKNFYSVWSQLKKALTLSDGSCPYLLRHRAGCSFSAEHVRSDIMRLDEICREFLFEEPHFEHWPNLLIELGNDFSSDLVPSETSNQLIVRTREEYRAKIVDALVVAALGFMAKDSARRAVWCAQMALAHDDTREDAHVALIRAEMASGQRTKAMESFRKCREILSEKLGVDPSPETMMLYQQLLEAEGCACVHA